MIFRNLNDIIAFTNQYGDQASDQAKTILDKEVHDRIKEVLSQTKNWIKRENLFENIGLSNHSKNRKKYLDPLIDIGWVAKEFPKTKTHPFQRYKLTDSGANLLKLLRRV